MVVLRLALLLLFLGTVWSSQWYPDFRVGVETAKREGKLVLLYFYEEGCSYCKYMEDAVFIDPRVSTIMDNVFVVVPVDVDNTPPELDRRFRAVGTPTFFVYDPKRDRVIMQIFGLQESDEFFELLKSACKKSGVQRC